MKRLIDTHLLTWKNDESRKPLLLRGARQIGKTFAVRILGTNFENFIEINFELTPDATLLFDKDLQPERLIRELSLFVGKQIIPGKTLLFFDEIQAAPKVLSALRYFYELMPSLHVIAAGSLLDFTTEELGIPVGRVMSLYMYPMSFIEFLYALKQELLVEEILKHTTEMPLSEPIHQKLLSFLGEYLAIGGMPEIVKTWQEKKIYLPALAYNKHLLTPIDKILINMQKNSKLSI